MTIMVASVSDFWEAVAAVDPSFTPVSREIGKAMGMQAAGVYGTVWRLCQVRGGRCLASNALVAFLAFGSPSKTAAAIRELIQAGYLSAHGTARRRILMVARVPSDFTDSDGLLAECVRIDTERGFGGCAQCGRSATEADHIVPRSRGGSDDRANLQPLCWNCNHAKLDLTMEEWAGVQP